MSMRGYVKFPITYDPNELLQAAYLYIKSRAPSWRENDGNLDTWILQIMSTQGADLRRLASDVPDEIFRYFGLTLIGLQPIDASSAVTFSTWTLTNDVGHIIPEGTFVAIPDLLGELHAFRTVEDITVAPGSSATGIGEVRLEAAIPGAASSGIGSPMLEAELITTLDFVSQVVITAPTSGGQDAESPEDYNYRLLLLLRRLSRRPILPIDFSMQTLDVAGVWRATAIDNYNPADDTYDNERMIAIAALDKDGNNVGPSVKANIDALLQANREINFIVNVIDATRTQIDVTFTGKAVSGMDPVAVEAAAIAAVEDYLSPKKWGRDPTITGTAQDRTWIDVRKVYYFEVAQVLSNVPGLDYILTLNIGLHGGALSNADVTIDGPAAIAEAGTISGDIT